MTQIRPTERAATLCLPVHMRCSSNSKCISTCSFLLVALLLPTSCMEQEGTTNTTISDSSPSTSNSTAAEHDDQGGLPRQGKRWGSRGPTMTSMVARLGNETKEALVVPAETWSIFTDGDVQVSSKYEPTGCRASGYCSLRHVSPYLGDVYFTTGLKGCLEARGYRQEIIIISETRINPAYQVGETGQGPCREAVQQDCMQACVICSLTRPWSFIHCERGLHAECMQNLQSSASSARGNPESLLQLVSAHPALISNQ